ncbi:sigma-54 dependent transcriptional regulator [Parabacteroides distasonis]|uniref:sigma-54-dependent transcriptional regulator n=1 Tax=Parabacteroides distasonis TaxID=823 RepID=UPI0034AFDD9B
MKIVLVVEDDRIYARVVANWLMRNGINSRYVLSVTAAKEFIVCENETGLVLSDFRLQDGNGVELLEWIKSKGYRMPFLIMTSYGDIPGAVEAVKKGATDYLPKPIQSEKVLEMIAGLMKEKKDTGGNGWIYYRGTSPLAVKLQEHIRLVAPVDTLTVLVRGASGTGKEYVARQIHALSGRVDAPFVAVDCGALPKELAASELFGHVKGAFTGAVEDKTGMFAAANHGTLFLDEVGNLGTEVQMLLLRALQEKCFRPVGGKEEVRTDIRLVAATNEDLEKAIAEGRFREDLFHRLNEFPLYVPLLAECPEDIIPLAEFMLEAANRELNKEVKGFDRETQRMLKAYPWPGNIRELKAVVRRATLLAKDGWIVAGDLDLSDKRQRADGYALNNERTERENIRRALEATGGDKKAAATLLGISRSTLYLKMEKYRIG